MKTRLWLSLGSFLFFLVLLELALRFGGYLYAPKLTLPLKTAQERFSSHTIIAVGDSYTYGGMGLWRDSYPVHLQKLFAENQQQKINVVNAGICEYNSTQVFQQLSKLIKGYKIDSVILLVGAANRFNLLGYHQSKGRNLFVDLRLYKMTRILMTNLKGKILQGQVENNFKKQLIKYHTYGYTNKGFIEGRSFVCSEQDKGQLKKSINSNPERWDAYYNSATCYESEGQSEQAELFYKKAIEVNPRIGEPYINLGKLYMRQARYNETEALYDKVLEIFPRQAWPYTELGACYLMQAKYKQAEALYRWALSSGVDQEIIFAELVRYYIKLDKYDEAIKILTDMSQMGSSRVTGYVAYELAQLYIKQGHFADALDLLLKLVRSNPGESHYYDLLAKTYELQSKYDANFILKYLREIERLNPQLRKHKVFQDYISYFSDESRSQAQTENWLKNDLEKIVHLCKENNISLFIQNYPYPYHAVNRLLKATALKYSLPFVDNFAVFSKLTPYQKYFLDSDHLTTEGHHVMARNVYQLLVSD